MELQEFAKDKAIEIKTENVEQVAEEMSFPVTNDPTFVYKKETKMLWIGFPVDKTDVFTACCILDSMKLQYLNIVKSIAAEIQEKRSRLASTGMLNQLRKKFVAGLHK